MATKLKQYSDEGNLTELAVQLILNEKKTETGKVTLTEKKIRKYFPKEYNREQIEQVIYELLDNWKKKPITREGGKAKWQNPKAQK